DGRWDAEDYQEALAIIEEEADRLTELIENLLAASKLQAEGMRLNYEDVDLYGLIERVVERFRTQTDIHDLILDFPEKLPIITGDETRLRQVVDNLLSNAIKYSPGGGQIRISGQFDDNLVTISVADSGVGLRPDQLQHVFERFYRADDDLSRATQGTGLGLFLARAVIEAHGGTIQVESEPGKGSVFSFTLPRS
ncbi:MAG TPA: HAMP domain-containing sensor histidine kinase, partial [Aggregatilineales bacterium]|nr:HAMP domain-containing sensor histidine kinase [Aggregatilineales bacterium]